MNSAVIKTFTFSPVVLTVLSKSDGSGLKNSSVKICKKYIYIYVKLLAMQIRLFQA